MVKIINQNMFQDYSDILEIDDIRSALKIGKNSAYDLVNSGKLKSLMICGAYKIAKPWLIEYIESTCLLQVDSDIIDDSNNRLLVDERSNLQ